MKFYFILIAHSWCSDKGIWGKLVCQSSVLKVWRKKNKPNQNTTTPPKQKKTPPKKKSRQYSSLYFSLCFFLPAPAQNGGRTGRMVVNKRNFFKKVQLSHDWRTFIFVTILNVKSVSVKRKKENRPTSLLFIFHSFPFLLLCWILTIMLAHRLTFCIFKSD